MTEQKDKCPKCKGDGRAKCSNHITYACEKCDGSGYIEEDCPTCHGTGEKKLDRPREKIADLVIELFAWHRANNLGPLTVGHKSVRDLADQILALFPDGCATCDTPLLREGELYQMLKEAKREERERIKAIYSKCLVNNPIRAMKELEQALKEEK